MRKTKSFISVLAMSQILLLSSAFAEKELAKINGKSLSIEEFNKRYADSARALQFNTPSKQEFLDEVIKREIGIQEAKKAKLDKDPEIIERMNTVLFQALIERKLSAEVEKIHVTDEEAKAYYEKNPEIRTSHIFAMLRPGAPAEEEKKVYSRIKDLREKIVSDDKISFSEHAQRFSEAPTAQMGGDLNYMTRDRLDPKYYQTALALKKVGKISDVVKTSTGFNIIKLTGIRTWEEADKAKIKRLVFEERRQKLFADYMIDLRKKAQVSVNTALLKE